MMLIMLTSHDLAHIRVNKWINRHSKVTVIKPTCRHHGEGSLPFDAHPNIKLVPYSDHCSFTELKQFVKCVRPRCVKPSISHYHTDMSYFDELLDHTAAVRYHCIVLLYYTAMVCYHCIVLLYHTAMVCYHCIVLLYHTAAVRYHCVVLLYHTAMVCYHCIVLLYHTAMVRYYVICSGNF